MILTFNRSMARDIYQGQSSSLGICLLHQPQTPWLLLSLLQGGRALTTPELARQGNPPGLRAAEEPLSGHAGSVQWIQVDVHQHAESSEVNESPVCTVYYFYFYLFCSAMGYSSRKSVSNTTMCIAFSFLSRVLSVLCLLNLIHLSGRWGAMGILSLL